MKQKIMELMNNVSYVPSDLNKISSLLNMKSSIVQKQLIKLQKENIVYETKKHKFGLLKHFNMYIGKIEIKDKGFAFIRCEDFIEDFFVAKKDVKDAMNNDSVIFSLNNTEARGREEASVVRVIKRALEQVVGKIVLKKSKKRFVANDPKLDIIFEVTDFGLAVVDDVVVFRVKEIINSSYVRGEINEVIGNINDVGIDIKSIAYKYGFTLDFPITVSKELQNFNYDIEAELKLRKKVTSSIITIDGDDAKDLDDAISIERLDNGNYLLGVYIADVSYFVKANSPLDKEAFERGTSVYLADRVIPMLPHKLSNDWCSLNPQEDKLVIACQMEINSEGKLENHNIFEAIIATKYKMTYNNVNAILSGDGTISEKYADIVPNLLLMNELSEIINKERRKRGSLDFDIPEAKIILSDDGTVSNIILSKRGIGEKIIEDFMILTNETIASVIKHLELPFIYRIHDKPNVSKLQKYRLMIKGLGYFLSSKGLSSHSLQKLLSEFREEDKALATLLLRTMAKAKYSEKNIGHFGLASSCYTHFTAPIRRYPDLLAHRLLRLYLFEHKVDNLVQDRMLDVIIKAANHSSQKERDAIDCEYEVNDMKKAEFMKDKIGQKFDAVISSVTSFGLFASLANTVEGFIHIADLEGYFVFDDVKLTLSSKHETYKIGQKIRVRVKKVNIDLRQIDFEIIEGIDYGKNKDNRKKQKSVF